MITIRTNKSQLIELAQPTTGSQITKVIFTTETGSQFEGFVSRASISEGKGAVITEVLAAYRLGIMEKI